MTRDRAVLGWVLYDLANVIFALGVVGLYYPLWIVDDLGGRDRHVAIASSASMLVVFAVAPLLGLYADRAGSRIRPLAICTIVTCGLTMLIGQGGLGWSIAIFICANIAFGCGLVFYDALLPVVSTPATQGVISGYGVGAGFAGAVVAVACGLVVLALNEDGKPIVFVLLGCLFLVGAIPCFVWVRDGSNRASARRSQRLTVRSALARARAVPGMGRFLVGRILYTDAANTMFAFMSVYAVKEVGFSDFETQLVLLAGIVMGPIGAVKSGKMADTIGAKATLDRLILLWIVVLGTCAAIPLLGLPRVLFWLVAPLGGIAFGGTGTVDRALLIDLSPVDETGTFFGFFAMVGRFSAILGPITWALIADVLGFGRPVAVLALGAMALGSYLIFRDLPRSRLVQRETALHTPEPPMDPAPAP